MSTPHCPDRKELAHVSETGPSPHGNSGDPIVLIPDSRFQKDGSVSSCHWKDEQESC